MDFDDQFEIEHLVFTERKCRICNIRKNLVDGFYLTRKDRRSFPSAYSYECKECTIKRIASNRVATKISDKWQYPDW